MNTIDQITGKLHNASQIRIEELQLKVNKG